MNLIPLKIGVNTYAVDGNTLGQVSEALGKMEAGDLERLLGYLRAKGKAGGAEDGFPQARGDVSGTNGLWRVNWFNGRFLTAEALRSQDIYWDLRARLLGRVHPPGVVHGLDVSLEGYQPSYTAPALAEGASADSEVLLGEGLAFDGLGRPIVVGKAHRFPFRHLLERWSARPLRVSAAGTRFTACVCLEDDAGPGRDPGPAARAGTYLLLIRPEERPEGAAKVYGELCADGKGGGCEADGYRGGFGVFLARLPVDIAAAPDLRNPWDVRGTLSAWYFDVFEHSLLRRWDPPFAADSRFCKSPQETGRDESAVPLALVHVGADGSLCAFDAWIPRRAVSATQGATWTQALIGHAPPAMAYARLHQFQCMLHQSLQRRPFSSASGGQTFDIRGVTLETVTLTATSRPDLTLKLGQNGNRAVAGMELLADAKMEDGSVFTFRIALKSPLPASVEHWTASTAPATILGSAMRVLKDTPVRGQVGAAAGKPLNLYDRGFRHIPPMGFLPFDASKFNWIAERDQKGSGLDAIYWLGPVSRLVWAADRMAESYFAGTNVWTYTVVAVHDDDMLEDWNNVHTKDPVQLRPWNRDPVPEEAPADSWEGIRPGLSGYDDKAKYQAKMDTGELFQGYSPAASAQPLAAFGLFFDRVKAGMDGLGALANREIEIVKIMVPLQGTRRSFPIEGLMPEDFRSTFDAWLAGEGSVLAQLYAQDGKIDPPAALPRHFVAYVKQRLVLLDALYALLELLSVFRQALGASSQDLQQVPTKTLKMQVQSMEPEKAAIAKAVAAQPFAREVLVQSALQAAPSLRLTEDWSDYWTRVDALEKALPVDGEARNRAMEAAADEFAADNEGFGIVKVLLAIDATPAVEGSLKSVQEAALRDPLRDAAGNVLGKSLARQVFRVEDAKAFTNEAQAAAYAAGKAALTGKSVREATGVASDATVAEVLAAGPERAADLLGGEAAVKTFTQKLRAEAQKIAKAAEPLGVPDAALAQDYAAALEKSTGDAEKALADLAKRYSGNAAKTEELKKLKALQKTVGAEGAERVAAAYFAQAKSGGSANTKATDKATDKPTDKASGKASGKA